MSLKVATKTDNGIHKTSVLKERQKELEIVHQHKVRLGKKTFKSLYSLSFGFSGVFKRNLLRGSEIREKG